MVRPKASPSSLEIAGLFAASIIIKSENKDDFIARQGRFSIFSLLSELAPKARNSYFIQAVGYIHDTHHRIMIFSSVDRTIRVRAEVAFLLPSTTRFWSKGGL